MMHGLPFAMSLPRQVSPETLDHLAESDPRAIRSRKDLQRINRIMGSRSIMVRMLMNAGISRPRRIIELGAGDGTLMLALARKLAGQWPAVHLTVLDRQDLLSPQTLDGFHQLGWQVELSVADVLEWASAAADTTWDIVLCNLFLHHFDDQQLPAMLQAISKRTRTFIACEPRRARLPLIASHLVGCIGANAVTREDAVLSVHAGFNGMELSGLWPQEYDQWQLTEYPAGFFSHGFVATRKHY